MSALDDIRKLIFKSEEDISRETEVLLKKLEGSLVDYTSAKYETIINKLMQISTQSNGTTSSSRDTLSVLKKLLEGVTVESDRYNTYRSMDDLVKRLPEIGQALNVYVDNILSPDDYLKKSLIVTCPTEIRTKVTNVIANYEIEDILVPVVSKTLLYGDFFVEIRRFTPSGEIVVESDSFLEVTFDPNKDTLECTEIAYRDWSGAKLIHESEDNEPIFTTLVLWNPHRVTPIMYENKILCYVVVREGGISGGPTIPTAPTMLGIQQTQDVAEKIVELIQRKYPLLRGSIEEHPQLQYDLGSLLSTYFIKRGTNATIHIISPKYMEYFKIPAVSTSYKYGQSIFSNVELIGKYLALLEYSLLIYRLTRAAEKRVFKVDVGSDRDVANYIQQVIRKTKQKEVYLQSGASLDTLVGELSLFEDYYIPVREGREFFTVDTVPGGELTSKIEDIEYLRKKLVSGLGIPAIYLVQEDTSESKYTLSQENVKFARTIVRLQKILSAPLTSLVRKLVSIEYPEVPTSKIFVSFRPPMAIQMERLQELLTTIQTVVNTAVDVLPTVDKTQLAKKYLSLFTDMDELLEMERLTKIRGKKAGEGTEEEELKVE